MARIDLIGVTKRYGDKVAVRELDLTIADNEFFCVLGPPGSGKSTLLRLLLGLETPDAGEILINGAPVTRATPAERNLAMVFQNLALFPHMSAADNLRFPLVERGMPEAEIRARVARVAEKLHITPLLRKMPAHLSGGERQRVAIGRALVRDPNAYLMDDPIAALDARLREEMRVELKRLQRELHHTLVYVTHDQEEAMSVADRMAILEEGRVRQIGTPAEIYDRPVSRYVASLVGAPPMNFIAGQFDGATGLFRARDLDVTLAFERSAEAGRRDVLLGVRPEDLLLDRSASFIPFGISARVYEVEPLGGFTVVDLELPGGTIAKAMMQGQPRRQNGEAVELGLRADRYALFDAADGARLPARSINQSAMPDPASPKIAAGE